MKPLKPRNETIRLDGAPQMSRAGNLFGLLVLCWPLVLVAMISVLGGRTGERRFLPAQRAIDTLVLLDIFAVWVAYLWIGSFAGRASARRRIWRWMFVDPQPGATLDPDGIELRSSLFGRTRLAWDEVAGMEPSITWMRSSFAGGRPDLDLTAADGRVLLRVPASIYLNLKPEGSGLRRTSPQTLAEYVVTMRPDRFVLIDTHPDGHHYWFELAAAAAERATTATAVELGQLAAASRTGDVEGCSGADEVRPVLDDESLVLKSDRRCWDAAQQR